MNAKQLRDSILQQAIQGKLVPQDPNDEPASVLLDKSLYNKGKIPLLLEENFPFEIPKSWHFLRLQDVADIIGGYAFSSQELKDRGTRVIRISDVTPNGLSNKSIVRYNGELTLEQYQIKAEDILIAMTGGTVGKSYLVPTLSEKLLLNQRVAIIRAKKHIMSQYLSLLIQSPLTQEIINDRKNSTNDNISMVDIRSFIIPLPPLAEQRRIVAKIEELLPLVEQYGKAQDALDALNADLPRRLKQSILQQAIQGKLVPQDPNDEPIITTIKRVDNKIKTSIDEETPVGWCKIKMGSSTEFINGLAFKPEEWEEKGLPIIRIQNLSNPNQPFHYTQKIFDEKFLVSHDDLLFSWSATLDAFIWRGNKAWLNQHIFKLKPQVFIDKKYLYYLLKAVVVEYLQVTHGSTMKHITKGIFENKEILLPPLAEQRRIVAKIEELFAAIDHLV